VSHNEHKTTLMGRSLLEFCGYFWVFVAHEKAVHDSQTVDGFGELLGLA
jgi:hypothetical protein